MVKAIQLNDTKIKITRYEEKKEKDGMQIKVTFNVASDEYHQITTLLYNENFNVKVPEKDLEFRGTIQQYATSITNLYEEGKVGEFDLTFKEVN